MPGVLQGRKTMAIEQIADRLVDYAEGLYYRNWERWELLTLGLAVLLLLLMVVRAQRRASAKQKHLRERTPNRSLQKLQER